MWERQLLGGRADALDVSLISNRRMTSTNALVVLEKLWKTFEGRADWVVLIHCFPLVKRGGQTRCCDVLILCEGGAASVCTSICSVLRCFIVVEEIFPVHPAVRFELNGKVKVVSSRCVSVAH